MKVLVEDFPFNKESKTEAATKSDVNQAWKVTKSNMKR